MTATAWTVLLGAWIAAIVSPGPDFVAVLRASLAGGSARGLRVAFGVVCGISVWICAALVGIVALITTHPTVYLVVRWAGAVFLLGYGAHILWSLYRARRKVPGPSAVGSSAAGSPAAGGSAQVPDGDVRPDRATASGPGRESSAWGDVRLGFLTNTVGNPKAVVFFGALFAGILPAGISLGESVAVGVAMAACALVWFSLLALVAGRSLVIRLYQRSQTAIDVGLGILFMVLGAALIPWPWGG